MPRTHGFDWSQPGRIERVVELRSRGLQFHEIAKMLSEEWDVELRSAQVNAALKRARDSAVIRDSRIENGPPEEPAPIKSEPCIPSCTNSPESTPRETPPVVHTTKSASDRALEDTAVQSAPWVRKAFDHHLLISDPQLPYQHPGALRFVQEKRREWAVPLDNVLCVGDEFDLYFASRFEKSPDSPHTAKQEIEAGREEIQRWVTAFPKMRLCYSNHGGRLRQAAHRAGLPAQIVRNVKEIFGLPEEWRYAEYWVVEASRQRFRVEHGHVGPGGHSGLRGRPLNRGMATAWGHEHSEPAAIHIDTHGGAELWGMRVGSLIAKETLPAYEYNSEQGSRPVGSIGIVINGGRTPIVERM